MAYPSSDSGSASRPASGITSASQKSRSRAPSISSDRPSTIGHGLMSPPLSISPDAAFIAASAASQIVTNDHDNHANTWYDQHGIEPSGETALVSNAALQLVNNFLDQLLFSFLSIARSTSLAALRPAVTEVLKPKLAKDAINQADEELREYLGGGDDEDMLQSQTPDSPKDWDLELVWKRTRLRCMVYSSLGDMEEEDEDFYMEQEHLDGGDETLGETVSPAVAIFLTSILEFMGEQALTSAGQAAYHRMRFIFEKERKDTGAAASSAPVAERITVEEVDMDRVAFDRTIGRLWRAWKKRIRSPITDVHAFQQRSIPHELGRPSAHTRQASQDDSTIAGAISEAGEARDDVSTKLDKGESSEEVAEKPAEVEEPTEGDKAESEAAPVVERDEEEWLSLALSVPLPLGEKDVTEILLPGLGYYSDDEELDGDDEHDAFGRKQKKSTNDPSRPKSLMIFSHAIMAGLPTPTLSEPRTPEMPYSRKRANSLPTPSTSPYASPSAKRVKPSEDEEELANGEEKTEESAEEAAASAPNADNEAESDTPAETTDAETDKTVAPKAAKQKKRPSFPPPLQTTIIGAAITTTSPRAVPVSSMTADNGSGREDADEEFDEFTEEPEIMTSSRVSISGRSNSPSASEHGRPVSMSPSLPARSPSVHSLRVIDVAGPRSPVTRSRNGSIDIVHEPVAPSRASNTSRTSSISVQAIAEEGNARSVEQASVSSHPRTSLTGTKMARSHTSESISEAEEISAARSQVTSHPISEPKPVPTKSSVQPAQSAARYTASPTPSQVSMRPPPPPTATAPTKVTILSSTTSSGTFFLDDKPEVPAKTNEIVLPERSAKRQGISSASAIAGAAAAAVAASAVATGAAAASSTHTPSPLREQPPSPSRAINQPSPSSGREQQARAQAQAQAQAQTQARAEAQRAEAEVAGRKQSVASSISSSTSKFKPKRSSEESTVMRPEDVARNFEQLIQSDQTIQYTLTPENMRDMDSTRSLHDGSSIVVKSRKSEDARQNGDRSRSSSVNNRGEDKRSASISRANTFETTRSTETTSTVKLSGPVPRSPRSIAPSVTSMSSRARGPGPQAREARVPRESMADFAEFIRGTGPAGGSFVPPASRNGTMNGSVSNAMRTLNSAAGMSKTSIDSGRMSTFSSRQRYQAREAVVDKDDNSDLIDFIRRGPPTVGGGANNPRIPRTVAPFRTTMDSDQMSGAVGGRAVDANIPNLRYSAASTSVTESSMGSSAGLLKKDHKQPSPRIGAGQSASNMFDGPGDMPMPKRKTRRVKDPYAIDLSDEEDEFDVVLPISGGGRRPAPAAKEESLMDFLNSVPPPADTNPVLFDIPQTRSRQQPPVPKKKASAPSLMSRFTRNNSISSNSNSRGLNSSSGSHMGFGGFDSRSLISRAGSTMTSRSRNHIPIQVNIPPGLDKYGTTSSMASQSSMSGANRPVAASSGSGRVPMKKFEPREAQPTASRATQDLAEFFRNSGPPQSFRG